MSLRKPKAVVIHNEDNSDDDITPAKKLASQKNNKVKPSLKRKIRLPTNDVNDDDDVDLEDFSISVRKSKNKGIGLSIPILNEFEEQETEAKHTIENLQRQANQQRRHHIVEKNHHNTKLPTFSQNETQRASYSVESVEQIKKAPEYISLDSQDDFKGTSETDEENDEGFFGQDIDMLDDGRLALTEKQIELQKKLQDMDIEEAIYEAEISPDEEMNDWEESRIKQGNINSSKEVNKRKLPKFTHADDEPISTEIEVIQKALQNLINNKANLQEHLEKSEKKKATIANKLSTVTLNLNQLNQ